MLTVTIRVLAGGAIIRAQVIAHSIIIIVHIRALMAQNGVQGLLPLLALPLRQHEEGGQHVCQRQVRVPEQLHQPEI